MVSALAFRPQSKLVLPRTVHIPLYGTETTSGIRSSLGGSSFQQYGLDCISGRTLALTLLPAAIFNGINIKPALAAGLASILPSGQALASTQDLRALIEARRAPAARTGLLHKIFFGVNASGKLGTWRAGDTRTDVSMLINGLSMLAILGVWAAGAYIFQKREEYLGLRNLRREVEREQEYREVCAHIFVSHVRGTVSPSTLPSHPSRRACTSTRWRTSSGAWETPRPRAAPGPACSDS